VNQGGGGTPVTAVPNSGYAFANWTGTGGFATATANSLTVSNVSNNDSVVGLSDAILALKVLAGLNPQNVNVWADVNGDKKIGMEDMVYILGVMQKQ
jgi:hypothetical protein